MCVSVIYTERLNARDGLSHRWSMCVYQDVKGYLWVGTYDGLNRYDGSEFTAFRPSANANLPVSADMIIQIVETKYGKFQVNTRYGILNFEPESGDCEVLVKKENTSAAIVLNSGRGN